MPLFDALLPREGLRDLAIAAGVPLVGLAMLVAGTGCWRGADSLRPMLLGPESTEGGGPSGSIAFVILPGVGLGLLLLGFSWIPGLGYGLASLGALIMVATLGLSLLPASVSPRPAWARGLITAEESPWGTAG